MFLSALEDEHEKKDTTAQTQFWCVTTPQMCYESLIHPTDRKFIIDLHYMMIPFIVISLE